MNPPSVAVEAVAKAITAHSFPGGTSVGINGPHAEEVARAAIDAFTEAMGMRRDYRKALDHPQGVLTGDYRWVSPWLPTEEKT